LQILNGVIKIIGDSAIMHETNLKKLSAKLGAISAKASLESKDLESLREIRDSISSVLSALKECDCCGAAVTEIAKLEMEGVRAHVCRKCGIRAFKDKELILKAVRKKESNRVVRPSVSASSSAKSVIKSKPFKTHVEPSSVSKPARSRQSDFQPSLFGEMAAQGDTSRAGNDFDAVAESTGSKIMSVKKVHSIASSVAFPMNFDRTISFTKIEAQSQHFQIKDEELKRIVTALKDKGLLRIKDS
jgi:hypothetical protein